MPISKMEVLGDPWRSRCPEGHCSIETRVDHYWCKQCRKRYSHLVDWKTGQRIT